MVGFGLCGAWAVGLAALWAERIAVVATYGGRGTSPRNRSKYIRKINDFVRIPYPSGRSSSRVGLLEMAPARPGARSMPKSMVENPTGRDWSTCLIGPFVSVSRSSWTGLGAVSGRLNPQRRIAAGAILTSR